MLRKSGNYRWIICALLFFATTLNYLDRTIIGLLKDELSSLFSWNENDYSNIVICFQVSYALGLLGVGWVIDRLGTKLGYFLSVTVWSLATVLHGFVSGTFGFGAARGLLGLGESGNFPAANKTVAEWFPLKERALATGLYNSGANIGAIAAPILIPWILITYGWQYTFYVAGTLGLIWLALWWVAYEKPSAGKISQAEYGHINQDEATVQSAAKNHVPSKVRWIELLRFRQMWAFFFGKFFTDPVWWFFLFWLPSFLKSEYGLEGMEISLPLLVVFTSSSVGSILGGWLPQSLINRGMKPHAARSRSMLLYAVIPVAVLFTQTAGAWNMWYSIVIISFACAAHCAWAANLFATVSDRFPKHVVASVTGLGGMAGSVGGILVAKAAGLLFDHYKAMDNLSFGYGIMFVVCALAYVMAWAIMWLLNRKQTDISNLSHIRKK